MTRRQNGTGSFYNNKERKFWEYKFPYVENGNIKMKKVTGKTKKEALEKAQQFKDNLPKDNMGWSVESWMNEWLSVYVDKQVKTSTKERYSLAIKRHINPFLGKESLKELTPHAIQLFLYQIHRDGGTGGNPLSARTVNHTRMILSSALKCAVGNNFIDKNPCEFTKPIKTEPAKVHALSVEQCQKLVMSARQEPNKALWVAIIVALETGFRKGEVFGLKWSDIDFGGKQITVNRVCLTGNHGMRIQDNAKTKLSKRTVRVTDNLLEQLKEYRAWQETYLKACGIMNMYEGYVITSEKGTIKDPNNFTDVSLKRMLKRAGLSEKITFHDLRHTHATQLLKAGVDIKMISERLGHSSIRITLDTYAHVMPSMQSDLIKKLDGLNLIDK